MFIEEAHLATRLNHPNVVQVYEFQDFGDEGLLLAMEYVEGCDLGRLMTRGAGEGHAASRPGSARGSSPRRPRGCTTRTRRRTRPGSRSTSSTATSARRTSCSRSTGAVKIADFGIASARFFAEDQGVLKGKFGYMSPEQARGETVDRRSDLYALGVILWEILAGRPIHGGLGGEALLDIVRSAIVEPPTHVRERTSRPSSRRSR